MKYDKKKALRSLQGISVGDALGEMFFGPPSIVLPRIEQQVLPDGLWEYTDDTEMAVSILETLLRYNAIEQDYLARRFAERMTRYRGYNHNTYELLEYIKTGLHWKDVSYNTFKGKGSFGNGAAVRSAPIGAFFSGNTQSIISNTQAASEITHSHPEGIAGAIAVALAASYASTITSPESYSRSEYYEYLLDHMPDSITRDKISQLQSIPSKKSVRDIAKEIGNGYNMTAQDTVPFVIWCSSLNMFNFEDAFWYTVEGLGDRDTTCAMVCGIVVLSSLTPIPELWLIRTESLPNLL